MSYILSETSFIMLKCALCVSYAVSFQFQSLYQTAMFSEYYIINEIGTFRNSHNDGFRTVHHDGLNAVSYDFVWDSVFRVWSRHVFISKIRAPLACLCHIIRSIYRALGAKLPQLKKRSFEKIDYESSIGCRNSSIGV